MPRTKVSAADLTDFGVFSNYEPEGASRVLFARNAKGADFYETIYAHGQPPTGRTFVYLNDDDKRVISLVHDDQNVSPPDRTTLGHPVVDHFPIRVLSFAVNRAVAMGMVWDGKDRFSA